MDYNDFQPVANFVNNYALGVPDWANKTKITSHIQRLRDKEQTEEITEEIAELMIERDIKVEEIKERYPYPTDPIFDEESVDIESE